MIILKVCTPKFHRKCSQWETTLCTSELLKLLQLLIREEHKVIISVECGDRNFGHLLW